MGEIEADPWFWWGRQEVQELGDEADYQRQLNTFQHQPFGNQAPNTWLQMNYKCSLGLITVGLNESQAELETSYTPEG